MMYWRARLNGEEMIDRHIREAIADEALTTSYKRRYCMIKNVEDVSLRMHEATRRRYMKAVRQEAN